MTRWHRFVRSPGANDEGTNDSTTPNQRSVYALLALLDVLHYWILLRAQVYAPSVEAVIAFIGLLYLRRMR